MFFHSNFSNGSVVGLAVHLGIFIRGEWHMQAPKLLFSHLILSLVTFGFNFRLSGFSSIACSNACTILGGYVCGLFSSILLYRLSPFHRLSKFPGPRLARVSKLWHVWQCRDSRNHLVIERLHEEYPGPSELAVYHPDGLDIALGLGTKCTKSDFFDMMLPNFSLVFTRDQATHHARRHVWTKALTIMLYQNRINRQIEVLRTQIRESAVACEEVVINDVLYWFTFDAMGEFAFGEDFGMMREKKWHFAIGMFRRALSLLGMFSSAMWIIRIGFELFPWAPRARDWLSMEAFCHKQMDKRASTKSSEIDVASFFLEEAEKLGESHSATRDKWLKGDATTVIVAGSDTTAPSFVSIFYCLAKYPLDAEKIYEEVKNVDTLDIATVTALPHLNGVINEAMRLYPVLPTGISRLTPPEGVMFGNTFVPGNTKLLLPACVISKHVNYSYAVESAFVRGTEFIPERWYSKPEMIKKKHAFAPFGLGRMTCAGNGLAMTQLRLVTATLVKEFKISFAPGEDGVPFLRDMRDQLTAQPGQLKLLFQERT
ncbi:hypothetical protein HYFRA_00003562 [Hymenoscyphus fraxineus]|uniref:Cytochrome P450 n=1 Tax=Hymenoscyphus fraxineus TaxID=746836 RepID=A0A9N9KTJ6_9HELO|nr:hypothetical protein HYFRA_00003562 [Hymenoscyphus fraxineus]